MQRLCLAATTTCLARYNTTIYAATDIALKQNRFTVQGRHMRPQYMPRVRKQAVKATPNLYTTSTIALHCTPRSTDCRSCVESPAHQETTILIAVLQGPRTPLSGPGSWIPYLCVPPRDHTTSLALAAHNELAARLVCGQHVVPALGHAVTRPVGEHQPPRVGGRVHVLAPDGNQTASTQPHKPRPCSAVTDSGLHTQPTTATTAACLRTLGYDIVKQDAVAMAQINKQNKTELNAPRHPSEGSAAAASTAACALAPPQIALAPRCSCRPRRLLHYF